MELEISPFKSRVKLLVCEQCGDQLVSAQVAKEVLRKAGVNCEQFRELLRLCPKCRRAHTAARLGDAVANNEKGDCDVTSYVAAEGFNSNSLD
jgi:hypothetical protein